MTKTDNINFRGKFKQYDANGSPFLYRIGDTVSFNGKKYVATKATEKLIPGTIAGSAAWDEISSATNFYFQDENPFSPSVGDRWFRPSNGVVYNFVEENGNKFWIEFATSGAYTINSTTLVSGSSYSANISDYYIGVSYNGVVTVNLPSSPVNGRVVVVKDESGHAGDTYNYITIAGASASDTIDRGASAIINIDNASLQLIYRNGWRII